MKHSLLLLAVLSLAALSCQNGTADESVLSLHGFKLMRPAGMSHFSIDWKQNDCLSVFDGSGENREFKTIGHGSRAIFSGLAAGGGEYLCLFPYNASAKMESGTIRTKIPTKQIGVNGTVDRDAYISCCMANPDSTEMHDVCAVAKVTLKPSTVKITSIRIESVGKEPVSGTVGISFDEGVPSMTPSSGSVPYVNLSMNGFVTGGTYYIAICPGTYKDGMQLSFIGSGGKSYPVSRPGQVVLDAGDIIDFGVNDLSFLEEPEDISADPVSKYASYGVDFAKMKEIGHPRLFMTAADFAALKERVIDNPDPDDIAVRLHRSLMRNADNLAGTATTATHTLKGRRLLDQSRAALKMMFHCAYAYRMTGNEKYLARARKELKAVCAFPNWNDSHFLDPSEMALGVAVAYDWLYYDLPLEERTAAHSALKRYEMTLFKTYKATTTSNWNQVTNGGALAAAIAVYDKDKELAAYNIDKVIDSNQSAVNYMYEPNGNGIEGNGYWGYAMTYQIVIINALETAFGTSCDICNSNGLKNTGRWKLYMGGQTGGFNFSDSSNYDITSTPQLIWLAARFNQPELLVREWAFLNSDTYSSDRCLPLYMCGLVRYPLKASSASFPSEKMWSQNDLSPIVLVRDGWNYDASDKYFGFKGSGAYNSHSHMDAGSFVYDFLGVRWAWDISMGNYTKYEEHMSDLFDRKQLSNRWDILCQNNYFHNCLSFTWSDGSVKKWHVTDQVVGQNGSLVSTCNSQSEGIGGKMDLSCYYRDAASSVFRTVKLVGDELWIIDEIKSLPSHAAPFEWRMVTKASVSVGDGYACLTKGGKTVYIHTLTSGNVSSVPVYGTEPIERVSGWETRPWDSVQSYSDYSVVKFSSEVGAGAVTGTFTTIISPEMPKKN